VSKTTTKVKRTSPVPPKQHFLLLYEPVVLTGRLADRAHSGYLYLRYPGRAEPPQTLPWGAMCELTGALSFWQPRPWRPRVRRRGPHRILPMEAAELIRCGSDACGVWTVPWERILLCRARSA